MGYNAGQYSEMGNSPSWNNSKDICHRKNCYWNNQVYADSQFAGINCLNYTDNQTYISDYWNEAKLNQAVCNSYGNEIVGVENVVWYPQWNAYINNPIYRTCGSGAIPPSRCFDLTNPSDAALYKLALNNTYNTGGKPHDSQCSSDQECCGKLNCDYLASNVNMFTQIGNGISSVLSGSNKLTGRCREVTSQSGNLNGLFGVLSNITTIMGVVAGGVSILDVEIEAYNVAIEAYNTETRAAEAENQVIQDIYTQNEYFVEDNPTSVSGVDTNVDTDFTNVNPTDIEAALKSSKDIQNTADNIVTYTNKIVAELTDYNAIDQDQALQLEELVGKSASSGNTIEQRTTSQIFSDLTTDLTKAVTEEEVNALVTKANIAIENVQSDISTNAKLANADQEIVIAEQQNTADIEASNEVKQQILQAQKNAKAKPPPPKKELSLVQKQTQKLLEAQTKQLKSKLQYPSGVSGYNPLTGGVILPV